MNGGYGHGAIDASEKFIEARPRHDLDQIAQRVASAGVKITEARLTRCTLDGSLLQRAQLDAAQVTDCSLQRVKADGSSWRDARVSATRLGLAEFGSSRLDGAHFAQAAAALDASEARVADAITDTAETLQRRRLHRAARDSPPRRVLVLAIERTDVPNLLAEARRELERSHHTVQFARIEAA